MDKKIFGIDIGGSSVKYGIADQDGSITCTGAFPVSGDMGRQAFLDKLSSLCLEAREQGAQGLGISTLGLVDSRTGTIVGGAENLPFLIGANLKEALGSVFNRDHICVYNDADCFALGELWKGNAQDARSFFCLALGTGIGGSLVIDGALVQGPHFRTGEVGYFDYENSDDYWEKRYSTKTFMAAVGEGLGIPSLSGREFMDRIRKGDPLCAKAMGRWAAQLGRKLANIILLLDIDCVIIGGAVSQSSDVLMPALAKAVDACLPPDFRGQCSIRPAKFHNDSAILGAVAPLMTSGRQPWPKSSET